MVASVAEFGVKEPLVITLDNYILSGHRRHAAASEACLRTVPCTVEPITRGDPEFLKLLCLYNRQRVKTLTEMTREEIVCADPKEAYRALQEHRRRAAQVSAHAIEIGGKKHRAKISDAKIPFLDAIRAVLDDLEGFWPLTDRQIHYALLNDPPLIHASKAESVYQNTLQSYKALCELLTRARIAGKFPFNCIHDPTRPLETWNVHAHVGLFIRREMDGLLKGDYRNPQQSQPNHIEIIGEKNKIQSIIEPVAMDFYIPLTIGRGYCSRPPRYEMAQRFRRTSRNSSSCWCCPTSTRRGRTSAPASPGRCATTSASGTSCQSRWR